MPERQSKISGNTVGSMACEVSLNSILLRENNARITKIVMSRYNYYKEGIKRLVKSNLDREFLRTMLVLWKHNQLAKLEKQQNRLPEDAYTHLRCCMVAQYRQTLVEIKNEKKYVKKHATIEKGARVCYWPETGREEVIDEDIRILVDADHVNGSPGVVFDNHTAYCVDLEKIIFDE
jgi:hypothetical protein